MNEKKKAIVSFDGKSYEALVGQTLSDVISTEQPCGGHGKCGKCKVIARGSLSEPSYTEHALLTKEELENDVRLACCMIINGDCEIYRVSASTEKKQILTDGIMPSFDINPVFSKYGVSLDIGTTTLAAKLYDRSGALLAEVSMLNPQSKWGADVISRIEASLDGKASDITKAIQNAVNGILVSLSIKAKIQSSDIDAIVITGNTTMLYILVGESVEPLSHAPFSIKRMLGECLSPSDLGLSSVDLSAKIYIPSVVSAFIGADTLCALLSSDIRALDNAMLIDIGTNGEMALWQNGTLSVCSTAAGPAFEGVGISMGMRGETGAIDKVSVCDDGLSVHTIGNAQPVGICGSGLIDTVACMLELEEIDESGFLEESPFAVTESVSVTQKDIRAVQLAKSAICAGARTLLSSAGIQASKIERLYIAGGFGNYLNIENAIKIGLLPRDFCDKVYVIGNAALSGASMLLLSSHFIPKYNELAESARVIELSSNPVFSENYMMGMFFESI